jgi:hypothetical protein
MTPSSSNRLPGWKFLYRILTRAVAAGAALLLALVSLGSADTLLAQASTPARARAACLHYEPEVVRLSGVLDQSASSPDRPGTVWILRLTDPICTTGPDDVNRPERDVSEVELVTRGAMLVRFADMKGSTVTASGTLSHVKSKHPHAAVMLAVKGLVGHGHRETAMVPPTPREPGSPGQTDPMDTLVRDLESRLPPSSARELAAIQARWQDLAERDCRWEAGLSESSSETPALYASCLDRARRDRLHRLESLK